MTETDVIFKIYNSNEKPDPNCFCHFGWEGIGSFAFWKYARAYYQSAEILFEKFCESKGNYAILDGIGLTICFSYRHFIELSLKHLFVKFVCKTENDYKEYLNTGHCLNQLWQKIKSPISKLKKRVNSSVNIRAIEHYISEFNKFDENSMTLRYPINKKLMPNRPETRLDILNLHDRMKELYNAIETLSYELENQLLVVVPEESIAEFDRVYKNMHERIVEIVNKIDNIESESCDSHNIIDSLTKSESALVTAILDTCTDDELIMLDVLYYIGREIECEELRLPKNPYYARIDVKKKCIINMDRDSLKFGEPANEKINIWDKKKSLLVDFISKAMKVLDFVGAKDSPQT